jgi:hypothetical protein
VIISDTWGPHPNPLSVSKRASELLPELWRNGSPGKGTVENHHGQEVLFCAEWHGSKKGVTAYVHRQHVVTTVRNRTAGSAAVLVATLAIVAGAIVLARSL